MQELMKELKKTCGNCLPPKVVIDLVAAEEAYLRAGYWKLVRRHGIWSSWSRPGDDENFEISRNYAVIIDKSEDYNIGIT